MGRKRQPSEAVSPSLVQLPVQTFQRNIQTTRLIKPQNLSQKAYTKSIKNNLITIAHGAAGTGKSLLALHQAIVLLNQDSSPINRIIYLRANVSMAQEDSLGYLPGTLNEKILPLAWPVLDNLIEFMPESQAKYLIDNNLIEVLPISMVRGRSFANTFVIVDEAQNLVPSSFKAILTRISYGSKLVICGDTTQCDLEHRDSGLIDAVNRFQDVEDIGIIQFQPSDVVRHPIIPQILERYESPIAA